MQVLHSTVSGDEEPDPEFPQRRVLIHDPVAMIRACNIALLRHKSEVGCHQQHCIYLLFSGKPAQIRLFKIPNKPSNSHCTVLNVVLLYILIHRHSSAENGHLLLSVMCP